MSNGGKSFSSDLTNNSADYIYDGGNQVISNYIEGEVIQLNDIQSINLGGNNFYIVSSSGQLEIQNVRNRFVSYGYRSSDVIAYSYMGNSGGTIDGRNRPDQLGIIIGTDYSDNRIYAGNVGSSLWGGFGGNDTLTGGDGNDEFFYVTGSGSDVIQNAGDNDVVNLLGVNLSQITEVSITDSAIFVSFEDGGRLNVRGNSNVGFKLDGVTYVANRADKTWSSK